MTKGPNLRQPAWPHPRCFDDIVAASTCQCRAPQVLTQVHHIGLRRPLETCDLWRRAELCYGSGNCISARSYPERQRDRPAEARQPDAVLRVVVPGGPATIQPRATVPI